MEPQHGAVGAISSMTRFVFNRPYTKGVLVVVELVAKVEEEALVGVEPQRDALGAISSTMAFVFNRVYVGFFTLKAAFNANLLVNPSNRLETLRKLKRRCPLALSRPGTNTNLGRPEHVKQTPNGQSFPCPPKAHHMYIFKKKCTSGNIHKRLTRG
uniref:Uncharacterized protein n=1 Tax=Ananas comosus var. bracteatus TaxID=296719 RepID=A0A6V7PGC4_ANACO|nr:unnamed protein product [Ananas comosus var. bracteatus]